MLYIKCLHLRLIQDYEGKMQTLQQLTDEYPNSRYQVLSLLNLAQTYKDLEKNTEAINTYLKFIDEYPITITFQQHMLRWGVST